MSFEELIKKYEPSMAVPMYPKALVIDFIEKAYEAGLHADVHTDNSAVIAKLEAQIEKMKCCTNCKYYSMRFLPYFCTKNGTSPHCTSNCDKWEIKENDI